MVKGSIFCYLMCFVLVFTTGCWDRTELNDRAIWLATGWDIGEKEGIQFSGQIVVPSNMQTKGSGGGGSTGKEYIAISAKGTNVRDALQNMQNKLSREAFAGQRRVVLYGEEFAKRGLKNKIDANNRSPEVGIRTDEFVVKGDTAIKVMNLSYPLEKPPVVAVLKEHEQAGGRGDTSYLEFLIAANSDGIRPTLPAVQIGYLQEEKDTAKGESAKPLLELAGVAVFDQSLKLLGYLNMDENRDLLWVMGNLKKRSISISIDDGNAGFLLTKMKSKIIPDISNDKQIKFTIQLRGEGEVLENNTHLDLEQSKNLTLLQKEFENQTKEQVLETIKKVQKKYGADIFGFGEVIHKKHPQQWESLKKDWDHHFAEADISVEVDLTIIRIGMSGPSLLYKESEIE